MRDELLHFYYSLPERLKRLFRRSLHVARYRPGSTANPNALDYFLNALDY
jgi:hypothetical protein